MTPAARAGTLTIGGDLEVNRLGYGAMRLPGPGVWGEPADPDQVRAVLHRAVDLGVTLIDTADYYGDGVANRLIAEVLFPYPAELVIVTKFGTARHADKSWHPAATPEQVRAACMDNLRRLRLERLDLVHFRYTEDSGVPLGEWLTRGLYEITHFARAGYDDEFSVPLRLPVLPVHLMYPGLATTGPGSRSCGTTSQILCSRPRTRRSRSPRMAIPMHPRRTTRPPMRCSDSVSISADRRKAARTGMLPWHTGAASRPRKTHIPAEEDMTAMADEQTMERTARLYAQRAGAAYGDAARYVRTIPEEEWTGPTGCARWDIRTLAGHIVGEAIWFPNLTCGVTRHGAPYPNDLYESLKTLPPADLTDRLQEAADALPREIAAASPTQLQEQVDLGWTSMPLWQATYVALSEAIYHNWDLHVGRDPSATIPTPWAQALATGTAVFARMIADADGVSSAPGRYLLQVNDGVGPITLVAENGHLVVEQAAVGTPDVTLALTADQYVRLVAGRLPLDHALEQGAVTVTGDRTRLSSLNRIFRGIGGS